MKAFLVVSVLSCWSHFCLVAQVDVAHASQPVSSKEAACSLLTHREEHIGLPDDATLLSAYNAQVHQIRGLYATALMSAGNDRDAEKHPREFPAILYMVKPNLVSISGALNRDSSRGFEMTSDGHEFSLLVPEDGKKVFLVGPSDAPARSKILRENLRPQPFLDALRWQEGKLRATSGLASAENPGVRVLDIELPGSRTGILMAKLEFDLHNGVMTKLTAFGDSGRIIYEARYSDWREMKTMSEKGQAGCFPRLVRLSRPEEENELNLRILQVNLNPEIPDSVFRPHPPHGIPVLRLDGFGNPIKQ